MKRRKLIKGIFLFSLGTPLIFSCTDPFRAVKSLGLKNLSFKNSELDFVDRLSKIILPIQNIPALSQHTSLPYVMKVVNDVYKKKDRTIFEDVYKNASIYISEYFESDYSQLDDLSLTKHLEDLNLLKSRDIQSKISTEYKLVRFYEILKKENLQYLRTSQYILENYRYFEMVPGRYNGNFPISELPKPITSNE